MSPNIGKERTRFRNGKEHCMEKHPSRSVLPLTAHILVALVCMFFFGSTRPVMRDRRRHQETRPQFSGGVSPSIAAGGELYSSQVHLTSPVTHLTNLQHVSMLRPLLAGKRHIYLSFCLSVTGLWILDLEVLAYVFCSWFLPPDWWNSVSSIPCGTLLSCTLLLCFRCTLFRLIW